MHAEEVMQGEEVMQAEEVMQGEEVNVGEETCLDEEGMRRYAGDGWINKNGDECRCWQFEGEMSFMCQVGGKDYEEEGRGDYAKTQKAEENS